MENISVFIRLKPTSLSPSSSLTQNFQIQNNSLYNLKTKETFTFNHIIPQSSSNETIFTSLIQSSLSSLLKGINMSIFAYGQTSTGKTYTMRGTNQNLNGIIPLSIKEIFSLFQNPSITKSTIKVSYAEIYNETVNDLINTSKKNLEIRESVAKGVFVNNLTEIEVDDYDKVIKILNTGESNRIIAETKLNEKSSRSHTIFKINIEFTRNDMNDNNQSDKTYSAQLNLVDLAGSENVSKAKCEGIRLKEGGNINKSLLALSNVVNRLSQNVKQFINYRDSKLTRLLQTSLGGNSKTIIICTILDDSLHYNETLNTLHFGLKAKNVKTSVKINEIIDDKEKIILENNQLKSKIKMLQELINEKKETKKLTRSNSNNNIINTSSKILNKTGSSLLCTTDKKGSSALTTISNDDKTGNDQITALEKEISILKRLLINNKEELGEDFLSTSVNNDIYTVNNTQSGYKTLHNRMLESSAMKSPFNPYHPMYLNTNNGYSSLHKTASKIYNNNSLGLSGFQSYQNDYDIMNGDLFKENEELRRNLYEMRKTYYEVVQSKENQIKLLNQNHSMTLENCEKLIKEAEDNYLNLKLSYDQAQEHIRMKDEEILELHDKYMNLENSISCYKDEISKMKNNNCLNDIEKKYDLLKEEKEKLQKDFQNETDVIKNSLQLKEKECIDLKEEIANLQIKYDNEIKKLRNEITTMNNKVIKGTSVENNDNNNSHKQLITEYEDKIAKLEKENFEYQTNLQLIKETQIVEYQKLLDESFNKIRELNKELYNSKEKIKYLEKAFTIIEQANSFKEIPKCESKQQNEPLINELQNTPQHNSNNNSNNNSINNIQKSNNTTLLNKKRKFLPKIYHNIIDKNNSKTPKQFTISSNKIRSKENINITNITTVTSNEISTFQI